MALYLTRAQYSTMAFKGMVTTPATAAPQPVRSSMRSVSRRTRSISL